MQEKRRHPRVVVHLPVACEVSGEKPFAATAQDVSIGGAFVQADVAPAFGTSVVIVVDLPGSPGLRLSGVVRWTKPQGFGVQFGLLGAKETHALAGLVRNAG